MSNFLRQMVHLFRGQIRRIVRHYKDAAVLVRAKTGNYCLALHASVDQKNQGGNSYSSEYGVDTFIEGNPVK
jgi:hypothetical protein